MPPKLVASVALVSWLATGANANDQGVRIHTVKQLLIDGKDVASATGVTIALKTGVVEHMIRRGEAIADGTKVDVPQHLVVVIVSSGAKSTATLEPGSSLTFVLTGKGELVRINAGKVYFDVVDYALDFFRVQYASQLAADALASQPRAAAANPQFNERDAQGFAIMNLGNAQAGQGQYAAALTSHERALALFRELGDREGEAHALSNIAGVQEHQGQYALALEAYQRALAIFQQLGGHETDVNQTTNDVLRVKAHVSP